MDVLAAIHANRGTVSPLSPTWVVAGYLTTAPDADYLCAVSIFGSEPIPGVPATPGTYTGVTTVRVLVQDGRPVHVLGPAGSLPVGGPGGLPAVPPSTAGQTQTVTRTITPTASGTYRVSRGTWSNWGTTGNVYQGSTTESGQLWGLACYGDTITAIGATSITAATLTLAQNPDTGYTGAWTASVRGSASGSLPSGAPSFAGDTVTVSMPGRGVSGTRTVDLAANMREALRTGAARSLGLVGAPYGGTLGLGFHGAAWSLSLTCEVPK